MDTTKATRHYYEVRLVRGYGKRDYSTSVLALSVRDAAARAIRKLFGSRAYWHADSGLEGFGQVCYTTRCLTERVRLDVCRVSR